MVGGNFFDHDPVGKAGEGEPFGHDEIDFHPGFVGRKVLMRSFVKISKPESFNNLTD